MRSWQQLFDILRRRKDQMKEIENPDLEASKTLLKALCDAEAEREALDGRQPRPVDLLNTQIHELRRVLLSRMNESKVNHFNEQLIQELVKLHVDAVNSGEDRPPGVRDRIDELTKEILERSQNGSTTRISETANSLTD